MLRHYYKMIGWVDILMLSYGLFLLTVLQCIVPRFSELTGLGSPIEQQAVSQGFVPEVPTEVSFMIWFVIFVAALCYGTGQLLPGIRTHALVKSIRGHVGVLLASSCGWMVTTQLWGDGWWAVVLIVAMWSNALLAFHTVLDSEQTLTPFHEWITKPMLGLYSGWLTCAIWLNASSLARQLQPDLWGISSSVFALLVLCTVVGVAATVLMQVNGNRWYAAAVQWALYGIVWHNLIDEFHGYIALFASVGILLMSALVGITPLSRLFRYVKRRRSRQLRHPDRIKPTLSTSSVT
jgi:hypothetical protein